MNRIARREGLKAWSLLAARASVRPAKALLAELMPGDLLLLGARPGQGKTLLALELIIEAMRTGRRGMFFTLDYSEADVLECFAAVGEDPATFRTRFGFDGSDTICASYIIDRLQDAPPGTVVVIDYLQLLDQKRENPELMDQVRALKDFAQEREVTLVFISQIHRAYDSSIRPCPELADVRLPNPLDLNLFDKACFLQAGDVRIAAVG